MQISDRPVFEVTVPTVRKEDYDRLLIENQHIRAHNLRLIEENKRILRQNANMPIKDTRIIELEREIVHLKQQLSSALASRTVTTNYITPIPTTYV